MRKAKIGNFLNECYGENTSNKADLVSLNEVNARSLIDRHSKEGYVIVSPCRGGDDFGLDVNDKHQKEKLNQINRERIKELIDLIKSSGYSYTPVYGGFIENKGTEHEENVYERSFIIYNHYKDGTVGAFNDLSQEYFTDLHKNTQKTMKDGSSPTRFSFLESYINPAPQCYGERVKRSYLGEVFLSR